MTVSADSIENSGKAPLIGNVGWGFDLLRGNGGDPANGVKDDRLTDGFKQYAAWMNPRKDNYFALSRDGSIPYLNQGYISFGMPMLPVDQDPGWAGPRPQTFGQWAGKRIGELALDMHYRGVFAADYFIGLNVGADWHPRLINSFETWAGVSVQGLTVQARHDYLVAHYQPQ